MITIKQKKGESRKDYLIRIAIAYIDDASQISDTLLFYDGVESDGGCLADDLRDEFEIEEG